VEIG
jgi:hypothetical protein